MKDVDYVKAEELAKAILAVSATISKVADEIDVIREFYFDSIKGMTNEQIDEFVAPKALENHQDIDQLITWLLEVRKAI